MTLEFANVEFAYPRRDRLFAGLSFSVPAGAVTALLGPNGSGKSTLARLAADLLTPRSGEVTLGEVRVGSMSARERASRVAYVPQRPVLSAPFTVGQYVALSRFALPADDGAVHAAMAELDLLPMEHRLFHELSAGQQQRAAVARALAQLGAAHGKGQLLIADEPASSLDPDWTLRLFGIVSARARAGLTVVMPMHDLTAAARFSDHVLLLSAGGELVAHGAPAQVLTPDNLGRAFKTAFVSAPMNVGGGRFSILLPVEGAAAGRQHEAG